jgi:subtilisin family serine protease
VKRGHHKPPHSQPPEDFNVALEDHLTHDESLDPPYLGDVINDPTNAPLTSLPGHFSFGHSHPWGHSSRPALPDLPADLSVSPEQQTVVVIDTGLSTSLSNVVFEYDLYGKDDDTTTTSTHGYNVSSLVAEMNEDVNIVMLKVSADDSDAADMRLVGRALDWVIENAEILNVSAVNLSIGSEMLSSTSRFNYLSRDIAQLKDKGVAVVIAAGNSGATDSVSLEAADPNAIAVSALGSEDDFADYSNRNPEITDIVAAGWLDTPEDSVSLGTSFAAARVSGAISLLQEESYSLYGVELTVDSILKVLQTSASPLNLTEDILDIDLAKGYVGLDVSNAVTLIGNSEYFNTELI